MSRSRGPWRDEGITLIPGDGIGPEVTEAVLRMLNASGVSIDWDRHAAGVFAFVCREIDRGGFGFDVVRV